MPELHSASQLTAEPGQDPYLAPAFSLASRVQRHLWNLCWALFYRTSPRPLHAWRAWLLRLFGAKMGPNCHFYPKSKVWAPWNLICEDQCTLGDDAEIYNPAPCYMGSHAIVSQQAYICGATHDYDDPAFPLISFPIHLGAYSWICARASVAPRVRVGEGAVLGLAAVATRDMDPWTIYAGVPAKKVKDRKRTYDLNESAQPSA
ncbi:MAG: LbetaH domain-containing protein [Acidobacteriaceae bacterium]